MSSKLGTLFLLSIRIHLVFAKVLEEAHRNASYETAVTRFLQFYNYLEKEAYNAALGLLAV